MDPLTLVTEMLFGVVFIWALATWLQRRDPLSRDVVLVFAGMGVIFLLGLYELAIGPAPQLLGLVAFVLLLGQPALTLRLAAQIHPISPWVTRTSIAVWIASSLMIVGLGSSDPIVVPAAVGGFVIAQGAAAGFLAVAARRRGGFGAIRLWVVAAATAMFALGILALGSVLITDEIRGPWSQVARGTTLLAALGYFGAFLPPRILRRIWNAQIAYEGLRALLALSGEGASVIWAGLLRLARQSTRSVAVVLVEGHPGARRVTAVEGLPGELVGGPLLLVDLPDGEVPIEGSTRGVPEGSAAAAATAAGARFVRALDLGCDPPAILVLFGSHRSLFGGEDETLLTALGRQAAGLVEQRRLSAQLSETVAALQAASEAKSAFIASMSHELRTPLNAILGFSDLMRHEPADVEDKVRVPLEWVEHIHQGGSHLTELINDVLDLARVEAGRIDLDREPIDLLPAVSEVVSGLRPLADRKRLAVSMDIPAGEHALADRGRLRQILYNLLSNAIKFTPDGGRITIESRRLGDEVQLSVIDTGVGIAPEDLAAVFEEFRQVGSNAWRRDGSGLGLALTRRLLQAHGGRIEVSSTPGEGSRFTAILPAATVAEPTLEAATLALRGMGPGMTTVLVVEDDPAAARLLRAYLEPDGYRVRVAGDGPEAFEIAASDRPAAILLDIHLPGMDGWEVLRLLKENPDLRDVPVVIVTVVDKKEVGLALGAADYLVKPIERDALLASVRRIALASGLRSWPVSVLAIDDEPAVLELLDRTLTPAGYEVIRSLGGVQGVQFARLHRPDLVICDLTMPDLDGFGVVAALRADPSTADLPIVILTGKELTPYDKERLNGHVLGILAKGPSAETGLRAWLAAATT